jgi:uncharacterized radical SAM superfamily Fe-S cluster-containing enzyme
MAKEFGFKHIEINTNGLRLAASVDYCRTLKEAGVSTIYLQFDGVTPEVFKFTRGVDLVDLKSKVIENCREVSLNSIVLVCTLVKGVNDHEVGDIIRFAFQHSDVVRCVNFQPVSLCGRIPEQERKKMRITISDLMRLTEEQTDGQIKASDFYPVPTVVPVSRAVGALKKKRYVEFTAHPHCGVATYAFIKDGKIATITEFGNVDKFIKSIEKAYKESEKGHNTRAKMRLMNSLRHIKLEMLRKNILPLLKSGSYKSLGDLHRKMLMISSMHFMDPYNFDLERVQRCCIHYVVPDGRIIPFCTMNSIHRPEIEKKFGVSIEEWKKTHKAEIAAVA